MPCIDLIVSEYHRGLILCAAMEGACHFLGTRATWSTGGGSGFASASSLLSSSSSFPVGALPPIQTLGSLNNLIVEVRNVQSQRIQCFVHLWLVFCTRQVPLVCVLGVQPIPGLTFV